MKNFRTRFLPALAALLATLAACGGGGGDEGGIGGSGAPMGTLRMSLTDAPSCGYDAVNITVDKVRVNQNAGAGDSDAGWVDIVVDPPQRVDLLSLTNGVLFELGQTPLATGTYTQLRLVLAANDAGDPLANSVVPTGGVETPLQTPSGQESGLKANADITIAADQLADFVIDFDACKSVVSAGNSGKYLLKPVLSVVPNFVSGVRGAVDLSVADGSTLVALEQDGVMVKSTTPALDGGFLLEPVAPGTYDLVVSAPGHATAVVREVVVADGLVTDLSSLPAIDPPPSASGTVTGTVAMSASPIDASLDALQTLSDGTPIDVAAMPADSVTGAYAFDLATDAPMVATYASGLPLSFAPDAAAAGHYVIEATTPSARQDSGALLLFPDATLVANFSFP